MFFIAFYDGYDAFSASMVSGVEPSADLIDHSSAERKGRISNVF
jgi:hypothetical protein